MKIKYFVYSALVLASVVVFVACTENPPLPDNLVAFEADNAGITADESELPLTITLSREADKEETLTIQIEAEGTEYGTGFTTDPPATANTMSLPVAVGATQLTFKLKKVEGVLFDGDEKVTFTLASAPESLVLGGKTNLAVSFSEIVAQAGEMEVNGGGALYPNRVFIDLSANRQTAVERTSWDLGFSSGSDFRVILNSGTGMMARALNKTDLNAVTAADTVGFNAQLSLAAVFAAINQPTEPSWVPEAINWIDDPAGDLSKTAIAAVAEAAANNKVYIVNRGTGVGTPAPELGWKKIRIIRNAIGYTLQYADIAATSFSEIQIAKNTSTAFQYASFANGEVTVEPAVDRWDIAWTGFTNSTDFGTGPVPYYFQDIIIQNGAGVQTLQIMNSSIAYENFTESSLTGLDFGAQNQIKIGSSWRSGGGPGSSPSIRTDRYYIIKDGAGNYYKLRFTALTTSGERGKPKLEFALLKKSV